MHGTGIKIKMCNTCTETNEYGVTEHIGSHCLLRPSVILLQVEQDRQCTDNLTLRCFHVTTVDAEK